jgi:hypothetical protein
MPLGMRTLKTGSASPKGIFFVGSSENVCIDGKVIRASIFRSPDGTDKKRFTNRYTPWQLISYNLNEEFMFPICRKFIRYVDFFAENISVFPKRYIRMWDPKEGNRYNKRYHFLHVMIKNKIFKPAKRILMWLFGRHLVHEVSDIPDEPYNNLLRIHLWSRKCSVDFVFKYLCYNLGRGNKPFNTREEYLDWCKKGNFWSYNNRLDVDKLLMTMQLEDTIDREILIRSMLFSYHAMNEAFDGDVPFPWEYPMYKSTYNMNMEFMSAMAKYNTWYPPKDMMDIENLSSKYRRRKNEKVQGSEGSDNTEGCCGSVQPQPAGKHKPSKRLQKDILHKKIP